MKKYIKSESILCMAKEQSRGIFWVIDDELLACQYTEDSLYGVAKSGNTYNHKKMWEYVKPRGCNKNFDYYPRGRVEFTGKGKPIIYMNPNISDEFIPQIKVEFGLREDPAIRYDNSSHYKCYLDDGYKPQK